MRLSTMTPTIRSQGSPLRALTLNGGSSFISGIFSAWVERVALREVEPRHSLVDHGYVRGVVVLLSVPEAALGKRDAQDGKVSRADEVDADFLAHPAGLTENFDPRVPTAVEGGVALEEMAAMLTPGTVAILSRIASKQAERAAQVGQGAVMHGDTDGHDIVRVVAQRSVQKAEEAWYGEARRRPA